MTPATINPVELAPGITCIPDLLPAAMGKAIVETSERVRCFRKNDDGSLLYPEVHLSNISAPLSNEFDRWLLDVARPLVEEALDTRLRLFPATAVDKSECDPPSLLSSPFTFVVKYGESTRPGTGVHIDNLAQATLVLNLNDDYEGGGTWFAYHDIFQASVPRSGLIFQGCEQLHQGVPVRRGHRYITTTWFAVEEQPRAGRVFSLGLRVADGVELSLDSDVLHAVGGGIELEIELTGRLPMLGAWLTRRHGGFSLGEACMSVPQVSPYNVRRCLMLLRSRGVLQ